MCQGSGRVERDKAEVFRTCSCVRLLELACTTFCGVSRCAYFAYIVFLPTLRVSAADVGLLC